MLLSLFLLSFLGVAELQIIVDEELAADYEKDYDTREDVLTTLIEDALEQFRGTVDMNAPDFYTWFNVYTGFSLFREYGDAVLALCRFGYTSILLEKLNRFHEEMAGNIPNHSMEKYKLYMYIGALFNTAVVWLENGTGEDVRDISETFCRLWGIAVPVAMADLPDE